MKIYSDQFIWTHIKEDTFNSGIGNKNVNSLLLFGYGEDHTSLIDKSTNDFVKLLLTLCIFKYISSSYLVYTEFIQYLAKSA